jgi:hypothetical protein
MYSSQNALDLVKYLCGSGNVQGQGNILWLLVSGSPVVLVFLLLSQEVYSPHVLHSHERSVGPPRISLKVQIWCLIQKHVSFNLVAAILATDWPVSLQIALQIFVTASSSSLDRVGASLSICTLFSAVVALAVKPNS